MKKQKAIWATALIGLLCLCVSCQWGQGNSTKQKEGSNLKQYSFPSETQSHEGTWLIWPHAYTYGQAYQEEIEPIWVEMASALHTGERVHIIAYNKREKERIRTHLEQAGVNLDKIDFVVAKSNDVWCRDTGPMFVYDKENQLIIVDFAFDGWGKKAPYRKDNNIPGAVANAKHIPIVRVSDLVLEGGSVELDGNGTAMLCKSSVISKNRNAGMTSAEAQAILSKYLGAANFIWLGGAVGEDITDAHIDGMARFYDDSTILSVSKENFFALYEGIQENDCQTLTSAKNAKGDPYKIITLPMTSKNVKGLDYKGSYLNYNVGNEVVLLPVYHDVNDKAAEEILSKLYKNKKIIPIDVTPLYPYGGMIHCITQQQPAGKSPF